MNLICEQFGRGDESTTVQVYTQQKVPAVQEMIAIFLIYFHHRGSSISGRANIITGMAMVNERIN